MAGYDSRRFSQMYSERTITYMLYYERKTLIIKQKMKGIRQNTLMKTNKEASVGAFFIVAQ